MLKRELRSEIKKFKEEGKDRGLAVIVGIAGQGMCGVKKDMETMRNIFSDQGLAVWEMMDRSSANIAGVIQVIAKYDFPQEYEFLVFYFVGCGGSIDSHSYIHTAGLDGVDDTLSIEKGIISPLRELERLRCMLLFDCCLEDNSIKAVHKTRRPKFPVPPSIGGVLVAFATFVTSSERADDNNGGVWTRFLSEHFNLDRAFEHTLSETWKKMVTYFKTRYGRDLEKGDMSLHGPESEEENDDESVDHPGTKCVYKLVCQGGKTILCRLSLHHKFS